MATTTAVGQAGRRLTQSSSSAARLAQSTTSSTSSSTSPTLAALHRRTALATRQATRRRTRDQDREERREGWKLRQEAASRNASRRELVRAERLARRQDWEMGALAPNRDLTARATYGATPYGALPGGLSRGTEVMKKLRTKEWGIVVGDRVVVVGEGHRDQGKIGKVVQVYEESEEVSVERVNVVRLVQSYRPASDGQQKRKQLTKPNRRTSRSPNGSDNKNPTRGDSGRCRFPYPLGKCV